MDWQTVGSTAVGVVLGGVITVATSWVFARLAENDLERRLAAAVKAIEDTTGTIPGKAADAVVTRNAVNALLALSPILTRAVMRNVEKGKGGDALGSSG
ncbi:hypothetical protein [Brevundimonas sp.]|uniref:hypothetical protein n=1 Tax=Brevundimonas sp. TaxID=1871086 RepID=UPI0035B15890